MGKVSSLNLVYMLVVCFCVVKDSLHYLDTHSPLVCSAFVVYNFSKGSKQTVNQYLNCKCNSQKYLIIPKSDFGSKMTNVSRVVNCHVYYLVFT